MYSVILEKGVFLGLSLYRGLNTCYRCYKRAPPVRKLSVPEKMRFHQMRPHPDDGRMRGRRGVRRGHDRHDRSRGYPNALWTAYGGQRGQVPTFRTKAAQSGVYLTLRGECRSWSRKQLMAADMDGFPCLP